MKKKVLSLALALMMMLALLPTVALAADSDFTIENGVLTEYHGSGGAVTIPSGVTSIGDSAFQDCTGLTSITIPSGVTSIGGGVFSYCESLTSVIIPSSVTSIGSGAFAGCESLTSVTIPSGVTSINYATFAGCTSLTSVTIPSSVTSIGESAFECYGSLTDIYYGGSEAQWNAISMDDYNHELTSATIHYNSPMPAPAVPTVGAFSDVKADAFYAKPVAWAVEEGITAGTSATTFSPNANCTVAQILTFLWRSQGEPQPAGTVSGTQYYATAAQWAKEQGLTDNFSAEADCTRGQIVTFLYRAFAK